MQSIRPISCLAAIATLSIGCADSSSSGDGGGSVSGTLATEVEFASPLAQDASHVYWSDAASAVWKVEKGGGKPEKINTVDVLGFTNMAVDDSAVYVSTGISVYRVPFSGSPREIISKTLVRGIAVDATDIYWTTNDVSKLWLPEIVNGKETNAPPVVLRMPSAGGTPQTVVSAASGPVLNAGQAGLDLLVDDRNLYWFNGTVLTSAPKTGGDAKPLLAILGTPLSLTMDEENLYLLNDLGNVLTISKGGGPVRELLTDLTLYAGPETDPGAPAGSIAVDATSVYVTTRAGVVRVGIDGASPTLFATAKDPDDASAGHILADSQAVYWEASNIEDDDDTVVLLRRTPGDGGTEKLDSLLGGDPAKAITEFGCGPRVRFEMLDFGNFSASDLGSDQGLVSDLQTGLVWTRVPSVALGGSPTWEGAKQYCSMIGMRLPTLFEGLGIAGNNGDHCAWPDDWTTWSSTPAAVGKAWILFRDPVSLQGQPGATATALEATESIPLKQVNGRVGGLCVSGTCNGNSLCACGAIGAVCTGGGECCSQNCDTGACALAPTGTGCTADATCLSGSCDSSTMTCT